MLLELKLKNYKSFYNETIISMIAENGKQEYKERLIEVQNNIKKNVLPAMVIYGGNASGKTSIISALNLIKQIVINGTIKKQINNKEITKIEISSFIHEMKKYKEPILLEVKFKTDLNIYNYVLEIFANYIQNTRKIVKEELNIINYVKDGSSVKEKVLNLYTRKEDSIILNNSDELMKVYEKDISYSNEIKSLEKTFSDNLDKEDLFLTTGFKSMINLKIETDIIQWFQNKLVTIVDFYNNEPILKFNNVSEEKGNVYRSRSIDRLIKKADFGPQDMGYIKENNSEQYALCSFYKLKGSKEGIIINSKNIESKGTIKLIDFWISFRKYFDNGGIFVLDEFDSSIHPELIGGIIDLFNNPDINKNNAQLIFNTHNPLFLQKRFFRRDQIMFVEKDSETYMSSVYKLSDYDVRNDVNYMKNYFEGNFGALPFIDFESVLDEGDE